MALVNACLTMLPRLEAEQAIARVNTTAVGSGHAEPAAVRALHQQWSAAARGGDIAPRSHRRDPAELTQLGFLVRRVPRQRVILTDGP